MKTLLIDHNDSFTHILADYCAQVTGVEPLVLKHQETSLEDVKKHKATHIVLSPGPGNPENPEDFSLSQQILKEFAGKLPILGVCLGHQGMAHHYGASIIQAPEVVHGKRRSITHNQTGLFQKLTSPMTVMRYHSLAVTDLPPELITDAHTEDGTLMAFHHKTHPSFGLQFHPESVGSEHGLCLLEAFFSTNLPRAD